jgi:hypothetical protein
MYTKKFVDHCCNSTLYSLKQLKSVTEQNYKRSICNKLNVTISMDQAVWESGARTQSCWGLELSPAGGSNSVLLGGRSHMLVVSTHLMLNVFPLVRRLLFTQWRTLGRTPLDEVSPFAETSTMFLAGFEPSIPSSERPQTYDLDRAATGIGSCNVNTLKLCQESVRNRVELGCNVVKVTEYFVSL